MKTESSRAKSGMGGGKKSSSSKGKHPHETHIKHFKNGGHVVSHHFPPDEDGSMPEPEEHVMPDKEALLAHLAQAVPDNGAAQTPPPAPTPQAAAAPPPQGM